MINFINLSHAINYRSECPFCHNPMKIEPGCIEWEIKKSPSSHYTVGTDSFYYNSYSVKERTFIKFSYGESSIIVDYETGEVLSVRETHSMTDIYNSNYYGSYTGKSYGYGQGLSDYNLFAINIHCSNCQAYRYVVQVHISLIEKQIVNIYLNSESLSFKDEKGTYFIRNVYSSEKTEYSFNSNEHSDTGLKEIEAYLGYHSKILELPLIPINFEEPNKTLGRVKNLVLFS
ncbi:MAG TPA: hypothetical protein VII94_00455 [Candidatus Saccharimonadales bacterium]